MSKRVLVTGAAGFVGSHVCEALLRRGDDVIGIDNFDPFYSRSTKERWLATLVRRPHFAFVELDVRSVGRVRELARGVECVVHLAARAGVRQSFEDPAAYVDSNVGGTARIIEAMEQANICRLVLASSSSVYGPRTPAPFREAVASLQPASPYGVSKLAAEQLSTVLASARGLSVAILRLFSVYGPRQRPDQAAMRFATALRGGQAAPRFGDGTAKRDFTYVSDVVAGVLRAADWTANRSAGAEVFNIGTGHAESVNRLIELVARTTGREPSVDVQPLPAGDVSCTRADISKARASLGYEPEVTLEEGVTRFMNWHETVDGSQP